jgi:CubicO group peptidase (beta-lactamase class C family)
MRAFIVIALAVLCLGITPADMDKQLSSFLTNNTIMGIALQITKAGATVYRANQGYRDYDRKLPITNDTAFRVASLSKSISSCGIMLLVEQGKLKLTDNINSLLGFDIVNPNFPTRQITLEMLLSHQSSLLDCSAYDYFLTDTDLAASGVDMPKLKDLLTVGGKYYNTCLFANKTPGTYFTYINMNYVIMGTIIEKVTNTRFDIWMKQNILTKIGSLSYNPVDLPNINNLAVLYSGLNGKWLAVKDNYRGSITQRNLTNYTIGINGAIYGPQSFIRATTD